MLHTILTKLLRAVTYSALGAVITGTAIAGASGIKLAQMGILALAVCLCAVELQRRVRS